MSIINVDDIRGYRVGEEGEEIVCINDVTPEEVETANYQDIILSNEIEREDDCVYYCDRCGKSL